MLAPCALVVVGCLTSCLDIEPVRATARSLDAGLRATDADTPSGACETCLRDPGGDRGNCDAELLTCSEEPRCNTLIACLFQSGCFERHGQEETTKCAVPCALATGVISPVEHSVQLVTRVAECGQQKCPALCY